MFKLEVTDICITQTGLAAQEALASQGIDFDFYGSDLPVTWEDGESDRRGLIRPDGLRWLKDAGIICVKQGHKPAIWE